MYTINMMPHVWLTIQLCLEFGFSRDLIELGEDIRLCALKLVGFLGGAITGPREDLLAGLLS
jgi:hypothetical protein